AWEAAPGGTVGADEVARQAVCLVVFVCTGNTCRSPMADAMFKQMLAQRLGCSADELPARGYCVLSAGVAAIMGDAAAEHAALAVGELGADLSRHRSRPMTPELAAQADYLVAMTRGHVLALTDHFRRPGVRPRLLSAAGEDVPDPIGAPP